MKVITAVVVAERRSRAGGGDSGHGVRSDFAGIISPALTYLGFNAYWERAIQGLIILCAVAFEAVRSRWRKYAGDFAARAA